MEGQVGEDGMRWGFQIVFLAEGRRGFRRGAQSWGELGIFRAETPRSQRIGKANLRKSARSARNFFTAKFAKAESQSAQRWK